MNRLWIGLVAAGLLYGLMSGKVDNINEILSLIGKDTLEYVLPMVAMMAFWCGILEIAKDNGMLERLQSAMRPLLNRLFPDLRQNEEAKGFIAANIVINLFGLGSAATPSGLQAMESMQKENPHPEIATRPMVTFLVLNTAGVTVLNTTILSLRTQFGSADPAAFVLAALLATSLSCIVGLLVDRWWNYGSK